MLGSTLEIYNSISVYQFIKTLLQVTMKSRAEILVDIFALLLRYFNLSCKNLTVTRSIRSQKYIHPNKILQVNRA